MMTGLEVVQNLMRDIGPKLDLSEVTEFIEDESWVLIVSDETIITVDFDPLGARLVFSTEVAQPTAQNRFSIYEQLLVFNHQWPETGGIRFALDNPGGVVVMTFDLALDGISLERIEESLATCLEQLPLWRGQILDGSQSVAATEDSENGPPPGAILA